MSAVIDSLRKARSRIVAVGTTPLTAEPEEWRDLACSVFSKLDSSELHIDVIAESDNQLFQHSLRTDTAQGTDPGRRVTFTRLKFRRDNLVRKELEKGERRRNQSSFRLSTLPLPLYVLKCDDDIWYLPVAGNLERLGRFKKLTDEDPWYEIVTAHLKALLDEKSDGRYLAKPNSELIELFDQDHIPRGIYPRDCFYGTDHYQYVVWDFVFSRHGELLIHKRKENAKDNRNMWDKSVGGHIDFNRERSSSDAAVRELIEELYIKEKEAQQGEEFSLLSEDPSKVRYLGEWFPEDLGTDYLESLRVLESVCKEGEEPWVFYKLPDTIEHNTPRVIPEELGGGERRLRVLADVFIFVANTALTPDHVMRAFQNSEFRLIRPDRLKSWIETGKDDHGKEFEPTPDLQYIMSGKLRDILDEVTQLVEYAEIRRAAT